MTTPSPLPTDEDAREEIARIVKHVSQKFGGPSMAEFANDPPIRKHYATADEILAWMEREGFRRSVVSTPSDDSRALIERFDWLRNSGVCSPTTRGLLDDAERLLAAVSAPPTITDEMAEGMARMLHAQSAEGRSGFSWPVNGEWGRQRDLEAARIVLNYVFTFVSKCAGCHATVTDEMVERAEFILRGGDNPWIEFEDGVVRAALRAALGGEA